MPDLTRRVLAFIRNEHLIEPHESVLVGVSGGIDSTALLYVLHSLMDTIPCSLAVAHVNHMLRGQESERDETFVRDLAKKLSLPLHVKRVDVKDAAKASGKSVQHEARDLRYDYFRGLTEAHGYQRIAIAHNQDDQVETFVLRVIKGTGVRGLSCIPVKRGSIIRPFLASTREEIEQYISEKDLTYVEDSSNKKDAYERNYVRHQILPSMERLNPSVHSRIMSLLGDLTALNRRLDGEAFAFQERYVSKVKNGLALPVQAIKECDEETRFRVLSLILGDLVPGFIALREHIRLIEKVLNSTRPSSVAALPHGISVAREYGRLVCTTEAVPPQVSETFSLQPGHNSIEPLGISIDVTFLDNAPVCCPSDTVAFGARRGAQNKTDYRGLRSREQAWKEEGGDASPSGGSIAASAARGGGSASFARGGGDASPCNDTYVAHLDADALSDLSVRTFRHGDRFTPLGMRNTIKLKDYFISRKIPRSARRSIPLLMSGQEIAWVIGERIDERFKVTERTTKVTVVAVRKLSTLQEL